MKHLDEYRDPDLADKLVREIKKVSRQPVRLMEVCGTHTVSIFRSGIRTLLPPTVTLISGPGCPVCVTATEEIDKFIKLCQQPGTIITTFGDLLRVPGSYSSLQKERAEGADIRIVYSTFDALEIACRNPYHSVVFLAVGFETTAPTIAAAVKEAKREKIHNFYIISAHKTIPPAMKALLAGGDLAIDGFICPGHVSVIIGADVYQTLAAKYHVPCVIAGFEPLDILQAIYMLVSQVEAGRAVVDIQYRRVVDPSGNKKALALLSEIFETYDAPWRGLGTIANSGLRLKSGYQELDAEKRFDLTIPKAKDHPGCSCGDILRGIKTPPECHLYRKFCTPSHPYGPCMVSTEGTCAAYYKYQD